MTDAFVLDASATMALFFDDEAHGLVVPVLNLWKSGVAVVPRIWDFEVANTLAVGLRRGRFDWPGVARVASALQRFAVRRDEHRAMDIADLVALADTHGLSAYDASYLALAEARRLPLATLDRRLTDAARAAGVELVA